MVKAQFFYLFFRLFMHLTRAMVNTIKKCWCVFFHSCIKFIITMNVLRYSWSWHLHLHTYSWMMKSCIFAFLLRRFAFISCVIFFFHFIFIIRICFDSCNRLPCLVYLCFFACDEGSNEANKWVRFVCLMQC